MAYQSTTLTALYQQLAARTEGQPFWTTDQARRAINEGIRVYSLITGIYRTTVRLTCIPEDNQLAVDGTLVKGTRVRRVVDGLTLTLTSINALDKGFGDWRAASSSTGPTYWAPVGLTQICLYPKVSAPNLLQVDVDGVRSAPVFLVSDDPDVVYLNLGDEEISTLLGYALHVLCFAKGIDALQRTLPLRAAFFVACGKRNSAFAATSLYRQLTGLDRMRTAQPMTNPETDALTPALVGTLTGEEGTT